MREFPTVPSPWLGLWISNCTTTAVPSRLTTAAHKPLHTDRIESAQRGRRFWTNCRYLGRNIPHRANAKTPTDASIASLFLGQREFRHGRLEARELTV